MQRGQPKSVSPTSKVERSCTWTWLTPKCTHLLIEPRGIFYCREELIWRSCDRGQIRVIHVSLYVPCSIHGTRTCAQLHSPVGRTLVPPSAASGRELGLGTVKRVCVNMRTKSVAPAPLEVAETMALVRPRCRASRHPWDEPKQPRVVSRVCGSTSRELELGERREPRRS
jgi:hypothetical protein